MLALASSPAASSWLHSAQVSTSAPSAGRHRRAALVLSLRAVACYDYGILGVQMFMSSRFSHTA